MCPSFGEGSVHHKDELEPIRSAFGEGGAYYDDGGEPRNRSSLNKSPDYKEWPKKQTPEDKKRERMRQGNKYGVREYYVAKPTAESFIPKDELPGGENPEDLLSQKEERDGESEVGYRSEREVAYINKLDEMRRKARRQEEAKVKKAGEAAVVDAWPKEVAPANVSSRQSGVDGGGMSITSKTFHGNTYSKREVRELKKGRKKLRSYGSSPNADRAREIKSEKRWTKKSNEWSAEEGKRQKHFEEWIDKLNKKIKEGKFGTKVEEKVATELERAGELFSDVYKLYDVGFDDIGGQVWYKERGRIRRAMSA